MSDSGRNNDAYLIEGSRPLPWLHREIASAIARTVYHRRPEKKNGYLNLGCGGHYIDGYCNADFFPFNPVRRLLGRKQKRLDWALDLRYPIRCKDNYFRGIFCEHTFEHIDVWDGLRLLKECHRVLEPGGALRLTVPSLEKYVGYYNGTLTDPRFERWETRSEAIWSLTHNYGHKAVYDFELLEKLLLKAGFSAAHNCDFQEGRDPMLLLERKARDWNTLYVEAIKG